MLPDTIPLDKLQAIVREAEERHGAQVIEGVCKLVGIGVRTVQGRERNADTARRRAVVVWILCDRLKWPQKEVARQLGKTQRAVEKMLRKQRVSSV